MLAELHAKNQAASTTKVNEKQNNNDGNTINTLKSENESLKLMVQYMKDDCQQMQEQVNNLQQINSSQNHLNEKQNIARNDQTKEFEYEVVF